jgi:ribosome-binding ATPase YchF (GTP1/OBG family)
VEEVARILERLRRGERNKDNVAGLQLLTAKPVVMVFNLDEKELTDEGLKSKLMEMVAPLKAVFVNAKLEAEMIDMDDADRREFLESYGVREDGLAQLAREVYATLGLQSFLTAGKKEVRAWTVGRGARAPEAAGVIHTDFQRGFVAAAVCKYDDLVKLGSEKGVKEAGLMRTEGKDYVVREGDVIEFRVAT